MSEVSPEIKRFFSDTAPVSQRHPIRAVTMTASDARPARLRCTGGPICGVGMRIQPGRTAQTRRMTMPPWLKNEHQWRSRSDLPSR